MQCMAKAAVAFGPIGLQSNLMRKLVVISGVIVSLTGMSHRGPRLKLKKVWKGVPPEPHQQKLLDSFSMEAKAAERLPNKMWLMPSIFIASSYLSMAF